MIQAPMQMEIYYPPVSGAIKSQQRLHYIQPSSGPTNVSSANGASNTIRFTFPDNDWFMGNQSYFQCKGRIVLNAGAFPATGVQFRNGFGSVFSSLKLYINGTDLETVEGYDDFSRTLIDAIADDATLSSNWYSGQGTSADLQSWATDNRHYILKPKLSIFNIGKLLPSWALGGKIELEMVLNNTDKACVCTAVNDGFYYELSDIRMVIESHSLEAPANKAMDDMIKENGLEIKLTNTVRLVQVINNTSNQAQINSNLRSVKSLLFNIREQSNIGLITEDTEFVNAGLQNFALNMSGTRYPQFNLPVGAPAAIEFYKSLQKYADTTVANQLTYANYVGAGATKALYGLDLETFYSEENTSGANFAQNQVYLETNHSAVSGQSLQIFLIHDVILRVSDRIEIIR